MDFLLRLRPWQLFVLLAALPLLVQLSAAAVLFTSLRIGYFMVGLGVSLVFLTLFLAWLWALTTRLHALWPGPTPAPGLGLFKVSLLLAGSYLLGVSLLTGVLPYGG